MDLWASMASTAELVNLTNRRPFYSGCLSQQDHPVPLFVILGFPARAAYEVRDRHFVPLNQQTAGGDDFPLEDRRRAAHVDDVHVDSDLATNNVHDPRALKPKGWFAEHSQVHVRIPLARAPGPGPECPARNDATSVQGGAGQHGLGSLIDQGIHAANVSTWEQSGGLRTRPCMLSLGRRSPRDLAA
jgi:hypothetical protein